MNGFGTTAWKINVPKDDPDMREIPEANFSGAGRSNFVSSSRTIFLALNPVKKTERTA